MNIFYALSQGKGSINEENTSSFLGYLMKPKETHGLRNIFLHEILRSVKLNKFCSLEYTYDIGLEKTYDRRTIDLQINIKVNGKIKHIIAIENKINKGAAQERQFSEEYESIKKVFPDTPITMVFLAPKSEDNDNYDKEYAALATQGQDKKEYLKWETVLEILKDILKKEALAEIEPLTDYLQHTIKAFIFYINNEVLINKIINSRTIVYEYPDGREEEYKVHVCADTSIRVEDAEGNYEGYIAKEVLRDAFKFLGVSEEQHSSRSNNTRIYGKRLFTEKPSVEIRIIADGSQKFKPRKKDIS